MTETPTVAYRRSEKGFDGGGAVGSTAHIPPLLCACRVCVQTLNTGLRLAQANCHRNSASCWLCVWLLPVCVRLLPMCVCGCLLCVVACCVLFLVCIVFLAICLLLLFVLWFGFVCFGFLCLRVFKCLHVCCVALFDAFFSFWCCFFLSVPLLTKLIPSLHTK